MAGTASRTLTAQAVTRVPWPPSLRRAADWAVAAWRLHTATPCAILLSLASLPVLAQSLVSAADNLVWPAWLDIWNVVPDYQRWLDGQYGWRDLVAPYYEHRIVLTRALLLLDAAVDRMAGRIPEAVAIVMLAGLGLLVWRMVRLDAPAGARADTPPLFWIALIGAISQYENINLPFQVQFPIACFSAALATVLLAQATLADGRRAGWLAAAAGLAGIVAAFSMGSGVLLAPCLIVFLALRRARRVVWAVFTPICALGVVLFFQGHASASQPGPPLLDWHLAMVRAVYSCNFLASSLSAYPAIATPAGACGLLLFGLLCAILARDFVLRGNPVPAGDAALCALCLMVVLCAPAGTLTARLLMGVNAALASRYATMSLLFAATLLGLCVRQAARTRAGAWAGSAFAAAGLAVMLAVNAPVYAHRAAAFQRVIVADAQLLINNVGVEGRNAPIIMGSVDTVRGGIAVLHANRLNIFDPAHGPPDALVARLHGQDLASLPACRGFVDAAYLIDETAFLVAGWIADQAGRHTAPWIAALDETGRLLGTARALTERPDVRAALAMPAMAYGFGDGFRLHAPASAGAARAVRLLGLFPGAASPICTLAGPARIGPLPILPAARLQGAVAVKPQSPPTIEGLVELGTVPAWRLAPTPAGIPAWVFLALGQPQAHARIVFHPAPIPAGQSLAIPFSMAESAAGRSLTVTMADGAVIRGALQTIWHDDGWRAAVIPAPLLALHGGVASVEIQAGGEVWLAVGAPVAATFAAEWSRLF